MKTAAVLLSAASLSAAYPGMMGAGSKDDVLREFHERSEAEALHEKRQLGLLPTVGSLLDTVDGLLGSVASAVDLDNKRPEPGYEFKEPGPNDSRGPCPGLNLLANYGYLPRDGYISLGEAVEAVARGFNMGTDLSTILGVFAVLTNGDIETERFYLGSGPGNVGGLNRHNTVEADISPNREDFYLGCGDNHHLSSRLTKQNVDFVARDPTGEFSLDAMGNQYAANAKFSQDNNPYLYFFPFPSIVTLGAYVFYPNLFGNGTYKAGGVANYESITSIIGAKLNKETGEYEYVPERWPEQGWYRRATPYGAVETLVDLLTTTYPKYPLPMAFPQVGSDNLNANTILCDIYNGIQSILPLALAPEVQNGAAQVTWALDKLASVGLSNTILGCAPDSLSPLYPNATSEGGPLNPPPSVVENAGDNVYNKVYFTEAPTKPQCDATA